MGRGNLNSRKDFNALRRRLRRSGIDVVLIGSVSHGSRSSHDIDILVVHPLKTTMDLRDKIADAVGSRLGRIRTDWGGEYFKATIFGDVDVFFLDELFRLAEFGIDAKQKGAD